MNEAYNENNDRINEYTCTLNIKTCFGVLDTIPKSEIQTQTMEKTVQKITTFGRKKEEQRETRPTKSNKAENNTLNIA